MKKITWGVALILLIVGMLGLSGCACSNEEVAKEDEPKKEETVKAPDVVGMTKDDARRLISDEGFTNGATTEEYSDTVAAGNVISQDPKAGSQVKANATIAIVISKGSNKPAEQVSIPDLTGKTQTEAEKALLDLKLVPMPADPVVADGVAPGKVFQQSVAAGTAVDVGSTVAFTVALGVEVVTVPTVVNQTKDDAAKALTDVGLGVDVVEEYNSSVAVGIVISQNPNEKIQVVKGTTVTLHVSKGAVPVGNVAVPDLSTLSLAQALQVCNSAGLVLNPTGDDLNGAVGSQSVAAGTMVAPGTTIEARFDPLPAFNPALVTGNTA